MNSIVLKMHLSSKISVPKTHCKNNFSLIRTKKDGKKMWASSSTCTCSGEGAQRPAGIFTNPNLGCLQGQSHLGSMDWLVYLSFRPLPSGPWTRRKGSDKINQNLNSTKYLPQPKNVHYLCNKFLLHKHIEAQDLQRNIKFY